MPSIPPETFFAGTRDSGVFRSTDNGDLWIQTNFGLTHSNIRVLLIEPNNRIFAGAQDGGMFRSIDNGNNWTQINTGLTNLTILSLAVDADGYLFAGSNGAGVFRSAQVTTSVEETGSDSPKAFSLLQNYPNPFNPVTKINYRVAEESFVRINLYNITGQKVKTLVESKKTPGNHSIVLDASDLTSGVYIYKMSSKYFIEVKKMILIR